MPKTALPLTFTQIDKAKPKDKEYNLSDGGGLYLRVRPTGSKMWLLKYTKPYTNKRTNISLGLYPALSLADARKKRDEAQALLAAKIDPQEHRRKEHQSATSEQHNTLSKVAHLWFEVKKHRVSAITFQKLERSLDKHVLSHLGSVPIGTLKAQTVIAVLKPLASRNALETVGRLCQRLNEIMIYALNTGLIDSNPLAGIKAAFNAPKVQNQLTIRPEELNVLMQALSRASIKVKTRFLIEWQLHTMVRPSEAAGTRWDEIHLDELLWVIPEERMKKKRGHTVPITPQMLNLLKGIRPFGGKNGYVFPSDKHPNMPMHSETANRALKRMGFKGVLVSHGLRSIASTALNEQGFDPDLIEAALAHVSGNSVRRAYNRADYIERRRPMMQWWSDYIDNASQGSTSVTAQIEHLK